MNLTESCQKSDIVSVKDSSCIIHRTSNNVDYRMKKGSEKPLCRLYLRFEYMNTNISRIFQRENRFSQILFFAILSLSGKLNFFIWNKSIKFSNHIYAKPLIYIHIYPFFVVFSTTESRWDLSNKEISNNPEPPYVIYILKTFVLVQTRFI